MGSSFTLQCSLYHLAGWGCNWGEGGVAVTVGLGRGWVAVGVRVGLIQRIFVETKNLQCRNGENYSTERSQPNQVFFMYNSGSLLLLLNMYSY